MNEDERIISRRVVQRLHIGNRWNLMFGHPLMTEDGHRMTQEEQNAYIDRLTKEETEKHERARRRSKDSPDSKEA